ncbi:FAD dependent oxidoreductase [Fomitopsis serialis]|uniref:FAD dependent oxidoreductase n=1 Tax=Fomitopsis serialis TaxID=139415 RepID=UPI00200887C4|nr:FAD dependent oxidoreductase [Neoantrodia serialis]KAH9931578.1 FAD dependent oxidoreductase [Neoantrodia serialis]
MLSRRLLRFEAFAALALSCLSILIPAVGAASWPGTPEGPRDVCGLIAASVSAASAVYYPNTANYDLDNYHFASSSSQASECSVEPGTVEDVATIIKIVGMTRTPFAVKSGGHNTNPGFSSATGVQIAMSRFNNITIDSTAQTATIGAGLIFDEIYAALEEHGVMILGARATGIGAGGFILGGGYSFLSNEHGLTVDTVRAFEAVLPDGTITTATNTSNSDLFWALKGGHNKFGIVTQFTMDTFPIGQVWGGSVMLPVTNYDAVKDATLQFWQNATDPKADILIGFTATQNQTSIEVDLFYDGPSPPAGLFDGFMNVPDAAQITSAMDARSYLSLVQSANTNATAGMREYFDTVSITNPSSSLFDAVLNETTYWYQTLAAEVSDLVVHYDVEPFLRNIYSHAGADSSAWPPRRDQSFTPMLIAYAWTSPDNDGLINTVMQQSTRQLTDLAMSEGQDIANTPLYNNYALYSHPAEKVYGNNLGRLRSIRERYDPQRVMDLAGGWNF